MDVDLDRLDEIVGTYPETKGNLISIMKEVQTLYSYLPEAALRHLAGRLGLPLAQLYAIATFYDYFSLEPKGRHQVHICTGTTCHVQGSSKILREAKAMLGIAEGQTTQDMRFSIDTIHCVGACSIAPVMVVGEDIRGKLLPTDVSEILASYK